MASAQSIKAGSAFIELLIDDKKLVKGLQKASKKLKAFGNAISGFGQKMAAVGAAIAVPLVGSAKAFSEMGDRIAKASARTGVSVEALSELAYAAELSGTNLETLEGSLRKMQKAIVAAAEGSETANQALSLLNLTVEDLRGLSPDEQFKLIAERLSKIQSPAVRAAAAMELFGKSGTQLLPLMREGAKGIEALQQQARDLGLTMSTEDAKAAEALNDTFDTLIKVLKQGVFVIGSALAPTLKAVAEWIIKTVVTTTQWIKQNRDLVVTILKVAVGVIAGGIALVALGYAITAVGGLCSAFAGIVAGVVAALGVMGSVIAAIVSPIGLVIVALGALGAYLIYVTGAGGKALAWLGERFNDLSSFASEAFQGIADALAAGDIALAAQILWLTLKVAWLKGVQVLESAWLTFRNFFIKIAYDAFYGVQAAWEITQNALCVAWVETAAFLSKVWTSFTAGFQKAWNSAINWTTKRILDLQGLFDSDLDVEAAKKMADQDLDATNKEIDAQKDKTLKDREQQRAYERDVQQKDHDAEMGRIGQESIDKEKALDDEYDKKKKEAQDELDNAKKEWKDSLAKAKDERKMKDSQVPDRLKPPPSIADYLEGLAPTIQQKTIGVHGTFNAMEAPGMRAGGATDRLTKAAEETAKNTKKLVDQGERDDQEFD